MRALRALTRVELAETAIRLGTMCGGEVDDPQSGIAVALEEAVALHAVGLVRMSRRRAGEIRMLTAHA